MTVNKLTLPAKENAVQLKINEIIDNLDTSEIFVARYNTTSFSDILSAYNNGKTIICKATVPSGEAEEGELFATLQIVGIDANNDINDFIFDASWGRRYFSISVDYENSWEIGNGLLQKMLESGANIKTINNTSLLGSGNITLADTDLSNLSATGQAVIDAKVNKSGDTMTATLWEQNDFALKRLNNISKGSNPASIIYLGGLRWINADGNNTDDVNRLANIDLAVDSNGDTRLLLQAHKNEAGSTDKTAIVVKYPKTGNPSCTFPNTTCVDGQWVVLNQSLISSSASLKGTTNLEYTVNVPNDGHEYEVIVEAVMQTGASSGNYGRITVYNADLIEAIICEVQTRTNATVEVAGSCTLPLTTSRKIFVVRNNNYNANMVNLIVTAYRRIGTNS